MVAAACGERRGTTGGWGLDEGASLSVTGEVVRTVGPHVVEIGGAPPDGVVVVIPFRHTLRPGVRVEVTGRVRTFRPVELELELGIDLGADVVQFDGSRSLVARSLRVAPETEDRLPVGAQRLGERPSARLVAAAP